MELSLSSPVPLPPHSLPVYPPALLTSFLPCLPSLPLFSLLFPPPFLPLPDLSSTSPPPEPQVLNAKPENVEREAEIVAQSGRLGAVTIATNMAGRGTDIILGGNAEFMARLKLREKLMPRWVDGWWDGSAHCCSTVSG